MFSCSILKFFNFFPIKDILYRGQYGLRLMNENSLENVAIMDIIPIVAFKRACQSSGNNALKRKSGTASGMFTKYS